MKKLILLPILLLTLFSCSPEEETQAPTSTVQSTTPEPEPETPAPVVAQYTLTVTAGEGGNVSSEGGTYDEGTNVSVTATPSEGYEFVGWEGNDSSNSNLSITVNSSQSLNALFQLIPNDEIIITDGTATDQDGNTFGWINYDSQDWAIENAEVVTYRDGTSIPQVTANAEEWGNLTTGAWCYYDNDPTKGKLYNWYAIMGIHDNDPDTPNKEFAPEGWKVPNLDDWEILRANMTALGYSHTGFDKCYYPIAKSMASISGWETAPNDGSVGKDQNLNNISGFNAYPVGYCNFDGFEGEFKDEGQRARFWSPVSNNSAKSVELLYGSSNLEMNFGSNKFFGNSVRFMRNLPKAPLPLADGTATDQDGNTFGWINYDSQDWAIENAEVVTYRDGTSIPQVTANAEEWGNLTTGAWCYYDNDPTKGKLYNWYAIMGIHDNDPDTPNKEFAPEGWHISSFNDWEVLLNYLIRNQYNYDLHVCFNNVARSMASTSGWDNFSMQSVGYEGAPGREQNLNNRSGFNAYPVGYCNFDGFEGEFKDEGQRARFWSPVSNNSAKSVELLYGSSNLEMNFGSNKFFGNSVRFIRD